MCVFPIGIFMCVYIYIYIIRHRAPVHVCGVIVLAEGSRETLHLQRCHGWTGHSPILRPPDPPPDSPFAFLEPLFRLPTSASKLDAFQNPKIQPKSPKKLRKPSPKPSQNGSQMVSYVPTPEMFKNGTTMVRKPHFGSLLAFRNRLKIDAKTPSKSALSWIPSWNPKKYDF